MKLTAAAYALVILFVPGCNGRPRDGHHASTTSSIINGSSSGEEHDAVVLLRTANGRCTATLVAPNLILTARHCVSAVEQAKGVLCRSDGTSKLGGEILYDLSPDQLEIYVGRNAIEDLANYRATARGKQVVTNEAQNVCGGDVALVLLDREVRGPFARIRTESGTKVGEMLTAVGWGVTEDGRMPGQRMMRSGVRVTNLGPSDGLTLTASEFMTGESTCRGDSGGPMFSSKEAIVGVASRGRTPPENATGDCIGQGVQKIFVQLPKQRDLLDEAFALSGYEPYEENDPPRAPVGADCERHSECSPLACVQGTCHDRCTTDDDCGEDMVCPLEMRPRMCAPKPERIEPGPPSPVPSSSFQPTDDASAHRPLPSSDASCTSSPTGAARTPSEILILFLLFGILQSRRALSQVQVPRRDVRSSRTSPTLAASSSHTWSAHLRASPARTSRG